MLYVWCTRMLAGMVGTEYALYFIFLFMVALGFEFRDLHLLGRNSCLEPFGCFSYFLNTV
jgi:hypothetical protein